MRPVRDRVIVRPLAEDDQTQSGILLRTEDRVKPNEGTVVSVGDEVSVVAPGDHIIFDMYAGSPVHMDGEDLLIMSYKDIAAVVE